MVTVQINSISRTKVIDWKTLKITNVLTRQVDTCKFDVKKFGTRTYKPSIGEEVKIYDDATIIFGGIIVKIEESVDAYKILRYKVECQDYSRLLDRRLIAETYTSRTVNQIIADIVSTYELDKEGITISNVDCSKTIDYIAFNYQPVSKCIEELADLINYDWYVDYEKDIHFFDSENIPAPFDLSDDGGNYNYRSLVIRRDNSQVRNSIILRGGEYLANTVSAEIIADGSQIIFPTGYKFSEIKVTVTGEDRDVGIDYINSPDDHDCLHNFMEKIIRFKDDDKPALGKAVRISGKPYIPLIVDYKDEVAVKAMSAEEGGSGIYEFLIQDSSIITKEAARNRSLAEITTYKTTLSEGEFLTYTSGLQAGQTITIQSTARDLDESFIINRVKSKMLTPKKIEYEINLVTTKTMGILEFLQGLVMKDSKKIIIKEDEIIDKVRNIIEEVSIGETIEVEIEREVSEGASIAENIRHNPFTIVWVLADYTPTGTADTKRNGRLDYSFYLY